MKVLFLGPGGSRIGQFLGCDRCEMPILGSDVIGFDRIVSHGYRHILGPQVFNLVPAINCHISLLPWNRGASPNYWSWKEGTPKGVTIHEVDKGIDTGAILVQREVRFAPGHTLKTSYDKLQAALFDLFIEHWPDFGGSYHSIAQTPDLDLDVLVS